jgi:D-alanyl-D-alanine carboxypeptidase
MRKGPIAAAVMFLATSLSPHAFAGPALLFDPADGMVLYAEDLDNQWHPASLTKIMTAYVTFEAIKEGKLKLDQKIPCSQNAFLQAPSKLGLPVGGELTVEQALKALIIKSANDVAVMLAEAVDGTDLNFVSHMNATARRLGMTRTTFVNPNGLPAPEQMTTARDLARLARAVVKDYPEYASYWSADDMHVGKLRIGTHNGLLKSFEGADGMKTGFICDSGYNVVASATREGRQLMAVVLGEPTGAERTVRATSLLEHGFQQYGWKTLFNTENIDTMPLATDAKGIMTIRQTIVSWDCGSGRHGHGPRKARAKGGKPKKAESADATPAATAEEAEAAGAAGAVAAPAASGAAKKAVLPGSSAKPAKLAAGAPRPVQAADGMGIAAAKPGSNAGSGSPGAAAAPPELKN